MAEPSLASLARTKVLTPERAFVALNAGFNNWSQWVNSWIGDIWKGNTMWADGYAQASTDAYDALAHARFHSYFITQTAGGIPIQFSTRVSDVSRVKATQSAPNASFIEVCAFRSFKQDSPRRIVRRAGRYRPGSFDGVEL